MHRRSFFQTLAALPASLIAFHILGLPPTHAATSEGAPNVPDADSLERWLRAPRIPVRTSTHPLAQQLLAAIETGAVIYFQYTDSLSATTHRTLSPGELFTVVDWDGIYLSGHCHTRNAHRTFHLSRIQDLRTRTTLPPRDTTPATHSTGETYYAHTVRPIDRVEITQIPNTPETHFASASRPFLPLPSSF